MAAEQIKINDGSKTYEIVNDAGNHICEITLNPSDTDLIRRVNNVVEAMNSFKPVSEDAEQAVVEMDAMLIDKMSELLRVDAKETIFSKCSPLTMLDNGEFYIVEVLKAITPAIEKVTKARVAKVQKRMSKYTAEYNK